MILSATKLYDMCNVAERAQWLDILIALIEYLRSGKSKVGYLNTSHERNMLHKGVEEQAEAIIAGDQLGQEHQDNSKDTTERETGEGVSDGCDQLGSAEGDLAVPLRRSARIRAFKVRSRKR